jgi:uncharacterized protein (DUF362 family)/NAD-dependent dihydropyrimidine dehydrogenase PreA subunit
MYLSTVAAILQVGKMPCGQFKAVRQWRQNEQSNSCGYPRTWPEIPVVKSGLYATVAAVRNNTYSRAPLQRAFHSLLDSMEPGLPQIIKAGTRVLVKPYLHHGPSGNYENRLLSHPNFIALVVEAVKDCGGIVTVGDEGSKKLHGDVTPRDKQWIYDLAEMLDVDLVSFAKSGARNVRSNLFFPRTYLLARAMVETDAVVNCANFQPHHILRMSGAIKNMFNAVIGQRQQHLHELFPMARDLARIVVDVCAIVKPTVSFLDMTTVKDLSPGGKIQPVGLLLASCDPVAVDTVAARAIGWDVTDIPTLFWGRERGLGCGETKKIKLTGMSWGELEKTPPVKLLAVDVKPETAYEKVTRRINKTILAPKPTIEPKLCTGCGDCLNICPVHAIQRDAKGLFAIAPHKCANCQLCVPVCEPNAVVLQYKGIGKIFRQIVNKPLAVR